MRPLPNFSRAANNKPVRPSRYKGLKQKTRAPLLKTIAPGVHRFIFGREKPFRNEAALNRYILKERFLGEVVQQNQFESIFDINPANRFRNHSSPTYTTRRYARNPGDMISIIEKPGSVLAASAKSCLTEKGQLLPVGNLPESVWTDDYPNSLAYLSYEHLNEKNKVKASVQLAEGATDEEKAASRLDLISKLEGELCNGSPITSTTTGNSLIENNLKTWGENDEYIEIDAHETNVISSKYIAALVLFAAKHDDAKKITISISGKKIIGVNNIWNQTEPICRRWLICCANMALIRMENGLNAKALSTTPWLLTSICSLVRHRPVPQESSIPDKPEKLQD